MTRAHPYACQPVALATKHSKEQAIAPALARTPGLRVVVPDDLDTDQLGTFTGETDRPAPPDQTALLKAQLGIQATSLPRALASEGAFGPHPHAFLLAGAQEILAFVDTELGIEVVEQQLTHHTNFAHTTTATLDAAVLRFAERVGFPSHGLVVRPNAGHPNGTLTKGIRRRTALTGAIALAARTSPDGLARIETDMRAHHNPTRKRQIALLARRLAARLTTPCPACGTPGYGTVDAERGLPCTACATPTEWIAVEIDGCTRCADRTRRPRRDRLTAADPAHCPCCNP